MFLDKFRWIHTSTSTPFASDSIQVTVSWLAGSTSAAWSSPPGCLLISQRSGHSVNRWGDSCPDVGAGHGNLPGLHSFYFQRLATPFGDMKLWLFKIQVNFFFFFNVHVSLSLMYTFQAFLNTCFLGFGLILRFLVVYAGMLQNWKEKRTQEKSFCTSIFCFLLLKGRHRSEELWQLNSGVLV